MSIWQNEKMVILFKNLSTRLPRLRRYVGYWNLIYTLARRDISARYARASLGFLWAILDPVMYMMVFGVLRSFLGISTSDMPYLIFLFSGLMPWTMFLSIVNLSIPSIVANAGIIKKTFVPRELFVLVSAFTAFFDFCMAMIVMVFMMIVYSVPFTWNLLWLPLLVFLMIIFALGFGMWVAAYGIFKRDIQKFVSYGLQILFFLSPIFYPSDKVPVEFLPIYKLNPLVGLLQGFRNVLGAGTQPDLGTLGIALPSILLVIVIGWRTFRRKAIYFADYL